MRQPRTIGARGAALAKNVSLLSACASGPWNEKSSATRLRALSKSPDQKAARYSLTTCDRSPWCYLRLPGSRVQGREATLQRSGVGELGPLLDHAVAHGAEG